MIDLLEFLFGEFNTISSLTVYIIGFIFVILVLLVSIDDLIWDIFYGIGKLFRKIKTPIINADRVNAKIPRKLAVMIAAYDEGNVLGEVINNLILSNQYPRSMYDIFLGVYPNDPGTISVADELVRKFKNVHKVIHVLEGPSSKADNLNNIIKYIFEYEQKHYIRYKGFVVHDSEDLVHPYEFMLENYLLDEHAAIQIPVFPLMERPKIGNIFRNMVSGTYADEFAENHYRIMTIRSATKAFVPSAGTGFVIRRDLINTFPGHAVFPVGSLTEDYKLSLQFKEKGYDLYYVLNNVVRIDPKGKIKREFISTRSIFPSKYRDAVRQKTRWIYGITMQTFKLRRILNLKGLSFISKYSLYRDWKAKFGNLLLGPGYLIFAYFILSLFVEVPVMFPMYSTSWYFVVFLSILMIERQILRYVAVKNVYGRKSGIISSFFPPILPFRLVLGNIINFNATVLAWKKQLFGDRGNAKKVPKWSKTEHSFLSLEVLKRYKRNLGDTLLYQGLITSDKLNKSLRNANETMKKLGAELIETGVVSEEDITKAVCNVTQKIYVDKCPIGASEKYKARHGLDTLIKANALPLFRFSEGLVVMTTIDTEEEKLKEILKEDNLYLIYSTQKKIYDCLQCENNCQVFEGYRYIEDYLLQGVITIEQGVLALMHGGDYLLKETLKEMGLLVGYDESIIDRMKILRADEVPWGVRSQMTRLFMKEYAPWIPDILKKEKRSFEILSNIFSLEQFYIAFIGEKLLGMAASSQGGSSPINFDSKYTDMIDVFGIHADNFAVNKLKEDCYKEYKDSAIEKKLLIFYATIPQLKDRGIDEKIRNYIDSRSEWI